MNLKKIMAVLVAVLVMIPAAVAGNPQKALQKAKDKERKEVMKRYKGWQVLGSSRSLEVALLTHWNKLDEMADKGREIVGTSTGTKTKDMGQKIASNNAITNYAAESTSTIEGQLINDFGGSDVDVQKEFANLFGAFRRNTNKEISGEIKQSFALCHQNPDGTYEIHAFYIVDEDAATANRIRALRNAMAESEVAAEHAQKINDFISRNLSK